MGMARLTRGRTVEVYPLDFLVKGRVDVIKVDAEGMAGEVLRGATGLLESGPDLFVECQDEAEYDAVMEVIGSAYRPVKRFNSTPTILFEPASPSAHTYEEACRL